jgi:hypothetical protein
MLTIQNYVSAEQGGGTWIFSTFIIIGKYDNMWDYSWITRRYMSFSSKKVEIV